MFGVGKHSAGKKMVGLTLHLKMLKAKQLGGLGSFRNQHSVGEPKASPGVVHATEHCCLSCLARFFEPRAQAPTQFPSLLQTTNTNVARIPGALHYAGDRRIYSLPGDSTPSCSCLGVSKLQLRTVSVSSPVPSPHPLEVPLSLAECILRSLGTSFLPREIWRDPPPAPSHCLF